MSKIIPFTEAKLPSFLANRKGNIADLTSHVGTGGFPVLSIKGKVFTLVQNQERKVIEKPDADGDMAPARALEIVIIKANPNLSKVYYAAEFAEGSNAAPDCASDNGKTPNPDVENPQSKSCATCKHNVWGSGKGGKGKACSDSRRLAIAAAGQLNEPMMLRVPPASLKPLAEYAKMLDNRGADYDAVVTKLKFDVESSTPLLQFTPVGFLTEEQYNEVQEQKASEVVSQITGETPMPKRDDEAFEQPAPAAKKPAPVEEAPAPKKKAVVEDAEIEEAVAPAKKAAPVVEEAEVVAAPKAEKPKAKVVDNLDDDLDSLLGALDD